MPTYQYQCTECGEGLEAVQKFTDDALTECPNCGGHLKKVFSAVGIVFKGSGFYRNDSRGSSSSSAPAVLEVVDDLFVVLVFRVDVVLVVRLVELLRVVVELLVVELQQLFRRVRRRRAPARTAFRAPPSVTVGPSACRRPRASG